MTLNNRRSLHAERERERGKKKKLNDDILLRRKFSRPRRNRVEKDIFFGRWTHVASKGRKEDSKRTGSGMNRGCQVRAGGRVFTKAIVWGREQIRKYRQLGRELFMREISSEIIRRRGRVREWRDWESNSLYFRSRHVDEASPFPINHPSPPNRGEIKYETTLFHIWGGDRSTTRARYT